MKSYEPEQLGKVQEAILGLLRPGTRVLEVGCATGYLTRALRERLDCFVTAVEIRPDQAERARAFASHLVEGDICAPGVREAVGTGYDYVLYADVLEHLADPWEVVRWTRGVLADGGRLVASAPNVAYYKIRKRLLLGQFDYTPYGIMDDTHLRFFTRRTFRALFLENGYAVDREMRIFSGKTDRRLWRLAPNAFTYQFLLQASPTGGGAR